jgi:hypothetical protein
MGIALLMSASLFFFFPTTVFQNTILVRIISAKKNLPFSQTSQLPHSRIILAFADVVIVFALGAKPTGNNGGTIELA